MSGNATAGLCRLMVIAPSGSAEVAVPADVALIDLMPALVSHAGAELADRGLSHDGWVLQRLGDPPLDEDRSAAALGLRDGETLHLRPRSAELPTLDFDDLIDGVSTALRDRADRWRDALTRRLFLGLTAVTLTLGLGVLLLGGPAGPRAAASGFAAIALLLGGTAASRALGDAVAAALLGLASVAYAAVGGLLTPSVLGSDSLLAAPNVLAGSATAAAATALAMGAVGVARPVFVAVLVATAAGVTGGLLTTALSLASPRSAAVVAALALMFTPMVPTTAFRLARLQLPPLPNDSDDLQHDIDPVPGDLVVSRAAVADRYLAALFGALGAVSAVCVTLLALAGGLAPRLLAALVCIMLLLRSRTLVSGRQRLALLVPAAWGGCVLVLGLAAGSSPATRSGALLGGLVLLAGLFLAGALLLPGRRLLPYWGRIADLSESLIAASIVPVVIWVLDLYQFARAIAG